MDIQERLIDIETALANLEKTVDDLNEVIIRQNKDIETLKKSVNYITTLMETEVVKPLSEETPPPHY